MLNVEANDNKENDKQPEEQSNVQQESQPNQDLVSIHFF